MGLLSHRRRAFASGSDGGGSAHHRGCRCAWSRAHGFTDGRDTPPSSARGFVSDFRRRSPTINTSPSARSAAAITAWTATSAGSASSSPTTPSWVIPSSKAPTRRCRRRCRLCAQGDRRVHQADRWLGGFQDGDGIFMANFRADRARQILMRLPRSRFHGISAQARRSSARPRHWSE